MRERERSSAIFAPSLRPPRPSALLRPGPTRRRPNCRAPQCIANDIIETASSNNSKGTDHRPLLMRRGAVPACYIYQIVLVIPGLGGWGWRTSNRHGSIGSTRCRNYREYSAYLQAWRALVDSRLATSDSADLSLASLYTQEEPVYSFRTECPRLLHLQRSEAFVFIEYEATVLGKYTTVIYTILENPTIV